MNENTPILGAAEAAQMAGVTRSHFRTMQTRGQVPEPQVRLACGPIWKRSVIERWLRERKAA
jgi:predicted DNA-binding transcriptional regulator AlpA